LQSFTYSQQDRIDDRLVKHARHYWLLLGGEPLDAAPLPSMVRRIELLSLPAA
jgi:hypothetical protein